MFCHLFVCYPTNGFKTIQNEVFIRQFSYYLLPPSMSRKLTLLDNDTLLHAENYISKFCLIKHTVMIHNSCIWKILFINKSLYQNKSNTSLLNNIQTYRSYYTSHLMYCSKMALSVFNAHFIDKIIIILI